MSIIVKRFAAIVIAIAAFICAGTADAHALPAIPPGIGFASGQQPADSAGVSTFNLGKHTWPTSPTAKERQMAVELADAVNADRQSRGLRQLAVSDLWSNEMQVWTEAGISATGSSLGHTTPEYEMQVTNVLYARGENWAMGPTAASAFVAWINHGPHHAPMVDNGTVQGVAVKCLPNGWAVFMWDIAFRSLDDYYANPAPTGWTDPNPAGTSVNTTGRWDTTCTDPTPPVQPPTTPDALFTPSRARLLDTRRDLVPTTIRTIDLPASLGWKPGDMADLNVTAVPAVSDGFLTVWPCGPRPDTSNLNYDTSGPVANHVIVAASAAGEVCVASSDPNAEVIVDLVGRWATSKGVTGTEPVRLLDTRPSGIKRTSVAVPSAAATRGKLLIVNLTAVDPEGWGFLTAHPCSIPVPDASNVNYTAAGQVRAGLAMVIDDGSGVCVASSQPAHILIDLMGAAEPALLRDSVPHRLVDTRGTSQMAFRPAVVGSPGAGCVSVFNFTLVNPTIDGAWSLLAPAQTGEASTVNANHFGVAANSVTIPAGGPINIYGYGAADHLVDHQATLCG